MTVVKATEICTVVNNREVFPEQADKLGSCNQATRYQPGTRTHCFFFFYFGFMFFFFLTPKGVVGTGELEGCWEVRGGEWGMVPSL